MHRPLGCLQTAMTWFVGGAYLVAESDKNNKNIFLKNLNSD